MLHHVKLLKIYKFNKFWNKQTIIIYKGMSLQLNLTEKRLNYYNNIRLRRNFKL